MACACAELCQGVAPWLIGWVSDTKNRSNFSNGGVLRLNITFYAIFSKSGT